MSDGWATVSTVNCIGRLSENRLIREAAATEVDSMQASVHVVDPVIEIPVSWNHVSAQASPAVSDLFRLHSFQVVGFVILFPLYLSRSSADYFFVYWISAIACRVFGLRSSMRFSRMCFGFFLP